MLISQDSNWLIKDNRSAYFGISYSNREEFVREIQVIKESLSVCNISLLIFVDKYIFTREQEKKMMETAFSEIDKSDILIVELTQKAIGVGIEVGYAKAKNKPIIYLKRTIAPYSTTVGGCSDYKINYANLDQLKIELDRAIQSILA